MPFQDSKETVDIITPASQVCVPALLLLILAGYYNAGRVGGLHFYNVCTKLCQKSFSCLIVKMSYTYTQAQTCTCSVQLSIYFVPNRYK